MPSSHPACLVSVLYSACPAQAAALPYMPARAACVRVAFLFGGPSDGTAGRTNAQPPAHRPAFMSVLPACLPTHLPTCLPPCSDLENALGQCIIGYTPGVYLQPNQKICLPPWYSACAYVKVAGAWAKGLGRGVGG